MRLLHTGDWHVGRSIRGRSRSSEFGDALAKLRTIARTDMPKLERALDAAGVPHTPGRIPEWKEDL